MVGLSCGEVSSSFSFMSLLLCSDMLLGLDKIWVGYYVWDIICEVLLENWVWKEVLSLELGCWRRGLSLIGGSLSVMCGGKVCECSVGLGSCGGFGVSWGWIVFW